MNYQIQSDNIECTPSMQDLAKLKVDKLARHFQRYHDDNISARVVMNSAPVDKFEVKIKLDLEGKEFFASNSNFSLETALLVAVEELDKQLEKDKAKHSPEKQWQEGREAKRLDPEDLLQE